MQTFSTSFLMNFQQNVPNVLSTIAAAEPKKKRGGKKSQLKLPSRGRSKGTGKGSDCTSHRVLLSPFRPN